MSESGSGADGGPGRREVAYRLFAAEFDDADFEYSESDEERAPNYVVTPSGARVNRLFVVGVLTEVEPVSDGVLRARVVDPTGAFVCYAGQYQPDERAFLERAEPPTFVAMTGKARTFQPDDADVIYTSVRPEAINEVDGATRDRWTVAAAEATVDRVRTAAGALALEQRGDALEAVLAANDVDPSLASGVPLAIEHYGTTVGYLASLADVALDAARLVAGEIDEVEARTLAPDAAADRNLPVTARQFEVPETMETLATAAGEAESGQTGASPAAATGAESESGAESSESARSDSAVGDAAVVDEGGPDEETSTEAAPEAAPEAEATGQEESTGGAASIPGEASDTTDTAGDAATASATETEAVEEDEEEVGDFDPGEYDLDEEEREEIEAEYGTEFQSGTEVDEPGEADIETPDPGEVADEAEAETAESAPASAEPVEPEGETSGSDEAAATADSAAGEEDSGATPADETADAEAGGAPEADLEDVVVEVMDDLDEGSGAPQGAVVEATVDRTGADEAAVEEAIQQALMDGRCYEPDDDTLQAI